MKIKINNEKLASRFMWLFGIYFLFLFLYIGYAYINNIPFPLFTEGQFWGTSMFIVIVSIGLSIEKKEEKD